MRLSLLPCLLFCACSDPEIARRLAVEDPLDGGAPDGAPAPDAHRHLPGIYEMVFTIDGSIAAGRRDGTWTPLLASDSATRYRDHLAVSPDGDQLVVQSHDDDLAVWNVHLVELPSLAERELAPERMTSPAAWSPDGTELVYLADHALRRLAVDGGAPITIAAIEGGDPAWGCETPSWSKGGIAVVSGGQLEVIDAASGAISVLDLGDRTACRPRWSPDGESILFTWRTGGVTAGISTITDGVEHQLATVWPGYRDAHARWSADGKSIAYADYIPDQGGFVQVMAADGSDPRTIAPLHSGISAGPGAWSSDGEILFASFDEGWSLSLAAPDGAVTSLGIPEGRDLAWLPVPIQVD